MPPSHDPTPPTRDGAPRPDREDVGIRPMLWMYGTGIALCLSGGPIVLVGLYYNARSWEAAGILFMLLSASAIIAIPGALVAMGHPYGAVFRSKRYVHPRLAGLVDVLVGLMYGALGGFLFVSMLFPLTQYEALGVNWILIVLGLVGSASLLALNLFDRRR